MEKELSFGQTVYIVSYFQQSFGSSRKRRMMCVIRNTHYEVVECRVVSFNDKEVYLHSIGFVKRLEIFIDKDKAEERLKQLEKEIVEKIKNEKV